MAISAWTTKFAVDTILNAELVPTEADLVSLGISVLPTTQQKRRVYILDVPPYQSRPLFESGSQIRESDYIVPLLLECDALTGSDVNGLKTSQQDLAALAANIEALCAADPSWGGAVFASGITLAAERSGPLPDQAGGFLAWAMLQLHVKTWGD